MYLVSNVISYRISTYLCCGVLTPVLYIRAWVLSLKRKTARVSTLTHIKYTVTSRPFSMIASENWDFLIFQTNAPQLSNTSKHLPEVERYVSLAENQTSCITIQPLQHSKIMNWESSNCKRLIYVFLLVIWS